MDTFNNLPMLKELYLSYNQISELQSGLFNNFPNLLNLNLGNNKIKVIQLDTFNNLPILNSLWLNNNHRRFLWQIRELQLKSYYSLSTYAQIKI